MIVEWVGGAKDGGQFEAPDDCTFIVLERTPAVRWPDGDTPLEDLWSVEFEKRHFDIITGRNGKHYVQWTEVWQED